MHPKGVTSDFFYNPFSVVDLNHVDASIVPKINVQSILDIIQSDLPCHIELVGKKGRGKTTHLQWIANHLPQYPIYLLNTQTNIEVLMNDASDVIFVDSIHHLPILKRNVLLRRKKNIVFTTHWTRKVECLFAGVKLYSIKMKGIESDTLKAIINKRLSLASQNSLRKDELFKDEDVKALIVKHKDDYRAIMHQLYDKFQL